MERALFDGFACGIFSNFSFPFDYSDRCLAHATLHLSEETFRRKLIRTGLVTELGGSHE